MPRTNKIRWRKSDETKLAYRVRAFNAKRTRLIKQVPELADILPEKVSAADLKKRIYSRADYNKQIAKLNRFMIKDAEDAITTDSGVVTTKYQVRELNIQKSIINRRRAMMRRLHPDDTDKGIIGNVQRQNWRPRKLNPMKVSKSMWKETVENFEAQIFDSYYMEKDAQYKENYIKAVKDAYGEMAEEELNKLKSLPAETIVDMFYYDPNLQLEFHYPKDEQEAIEFHEFFKESFERYLNEKGL